MSRSISIWLLGLLAAGCAYNVGYVARDDISRVSVGVFANDTFYRHIEVDLTRAVVTRIEKETPYRIVSQASADAVLEGRITAYRVAVLQENVLNEPTESQIVITVGAKLIKAGTGETLKEFSVRESESYSMQLGETEADAQAKVFRRAAQSIVQKAFDRDW